MVGYPERLEEVLSDPFCSRKLPGTQPRILLYPPHVPACPRRVARCPLPRDPLGRTACRARAAVPSCARSVLAALRGWLAVGLSPGGTEITESLPTLSLAVVFCERVKETVQLAAAIMSPGVWKKAGNHLKQLLDPASPHRPFPGTYVSSCPWKWVRSDRFNDGSSSFEIKTGRWQLLILSQNPDTYSGSRPSAL